MNTTPAGFTASITVYTPCACLVCAAGGRWFQCLNEGANLVAKYAVEAHPEDPDLPTKRAVQAVQAAHPGHLFRYLGPKGGV